MGLVEFWQSFCMISLYPIPDTMKTKILKITGLIVTALILMLWAAPFFLKEKITSVVRAQIAKNLKAHVNFSGTDISLFRNFPKISVGLENVIVSCVGEFQDDTLLKADQVNITCNVKSLLTGHGIEVNSLTLKEPKWHAVVHANGHVNWNIFKSEKNQTSDSLSGSLRWALQRYTIHKGSLDYWNEEKNIHIDLSNLEQEGTGNFSLEQFDLKTSTTADAVNFQSLGKVPYTLTAKTNIKVTLHIDKKTDTYSFNTDQVVLNGLKLHTEGFFQRINDSSYNMNVRYKVLSTDFRNMLSILPAEYLKDYGAIEASGGANFNGYIKGKYDGSHAPAFHANLDVINGYLKYPDLPLPVEHLNLGIQVNNPDGLADHLTINISDIHAEIAKDTIDVHLALRNLKTKPLIDFSFVGKLDLANIARCIKMDSSLRMAGSLIANIYAKGNAPGAEKPKKGVFQSGGDLQLNDFSFLSREYPRILSIGQLKMTFTPNEVLVDGRSGVYGTTHLNAKGILHNFYDYALKNMPLSATWDVKTDDLNLRDMPLAVPGNIDFAVSAEVEKLHFDNLDLQNLTCLVQIYEKTVHLLDVKASGLDGNIKLQGTYSTLENDEHPDIALSYDVKGVDIQKTFLAFNSIRRIMPVAKFMSGNVDAHMTLNGKMNADMTTDLGSLQGQGTVWLLKGVIKDFGPMEKISQSLDVSGLLNIPLQDVKADFSYKNGSVVVSPFSVQTKDMEFDIEGVHGFDQSLDYDFSLRLPRTALGKKGNRFVKNVVLQAAEKGIPVKIQDAVRMDVKIGGTINTPEVKTDMDAVVNHAETDLKKEVDEFVNAKLDSAKRQLDAHPTKKTSFVQTSYRPRTLSKHKTDARSAHKRTRHGKAAKKKKKQTRNYTTESKKVRSTASR
jgi:hypothetical protein